MSIRFFIATLLATTLASAMACERSETPAVTTDTTATVEAPAPGPEVEDSGALAPAEEPADDRIVARSEELPRSPKRIVSLAPNLTETLFALGAGDRVVGVTRFCDFPEEVHELPKVGGFNDHDIEAILALKPDLVMGMASGPKSKLPETLASYDIPYVFLQMRTIDETFTGLTQVGAMTGMEKQAGELVAAMKAELEQATRDVPDAERPATLFVLGHKPLVVAGPGTFGDEFITRSGGRNAAGSLEGTYPMLDAEQVIALDPGVIIDATMLPGTDSGRSASFWAAFEGVEAVKSGRVRAFADASLLRPGPRLGQAMKRFAKAIEGPTP